MTSMEANLPWVNLALFGVQLALTGLAIAVGDADRIQRQGETPLTPAAYAFSIWNAIYLLSMILISTDIAYQGLVLYDSAARPTVLRLCFAASCLLNGGWCLLFNCGLVKLSTFAITLLWLTLAVLYVFASHSRHVRPFVWREYLCGELFIRVYFAWISVALIVSWAISLQQLHDGFLSLGVYLGLLGSVVVMAICGVVYGRDPVFALVAVWAFVALTTQDPDRFGSDHREMAAQIQAAAALSAGVLSAMAAVFCAQCVSELHTYVAWMHTSMLCIYITRCTYHWLCCVIAPLQEPCRVGQAGVLQAATRRVRLDSRALVAVEWWLLSSLGRCMFKL